jgi:23S rRNA A1618 N6-methylase RlmF
VHREQESNISWITAFTTNQDVLEEDMKHINSVSMNTISCDEIALAQRDDTEISKVIKWIESKERLRKKHLMNHAIRGTSCTSGTSWNWTNMDYFGEKVV